jgi:hypothetical protein
MSTYPTTKTPVAVSAPVMPGTLLSGCVGLLPPQVPGDDRVVQPPVGDFIDVERVGALGVVAHAEGQDVERQSLGLLVAGDLLDDLPHKPTTPTPNACVAPSRACGRDIEQSPS